MRTFPLRKALIGYLLLLVPLAWFAMKYDRYAMDGDGIGYMDIADLLHAHRWAGAVNGYWHPLYPAVLWMGQVVFHTTHWNELGAYYRMNYLIFLLQVGAVLLFAGALARLRQRMAPGMDPLFSADALRLLGVSLLVIAVQREMTLGKIRTDGLLQGLILLGLTMLMETLAAEAVAAGTAYAALMGLFFGLAYLTKSFAFVLTLLSVAVLVGFAWLVQRRPMVRVLGAAVTVLLVFGAIAGPYVAALSKQKGRLTFGDSGSLNYVWYVSGTEKMHLQPWMTKDFGSAEVHLLHPEKQLLRSPGVYDYKFFPYGTYPPWFDATYFNDHIVPKFALKRLLARDARNVVLIFRYVVNHAEPLLLLAVLLAMGGATLRGDSRFAWPVVLLGASIWAIYTTVNVEERYVTVAYLAILLGVFATLKPIDPVSLLLRRGAIALLLLCSVLTLGELAREDALFRREESNSRQPAWRNPQVWAASEALRGLGLQPGDHVACIGTEACLNDFYWARLAGVRILTEIYEPTMFHLVNALDAMPNRPVVYDAVRQDGAKVLVGSFDPGEMNTGHPGAAGWVRLGETNYYAYPLEAK